MFAALGISGVAIAGAGIIGAAVGSGEVGCGEVGCGEVALMGAAATGAGGLTRPDTGLLLGNCGVTGAPAVLGVVGSARVEVLPGVKSAKKSHQALSTELGSWR